MAAKRKQSKKSSNGTSLANLRLRELHERHSGLTQPVGDSFFEAASVCLNRHHTSPVKIEIMTSETANVREAEFVTPDTRMLNTWANDIDTTEYGAYGVSLAAVEVEKELVAVRRAETQTGADWYIAPIGADLSDLESCYRLEVSGVDSGNRSAVKTRLLTKLNQARKGESNLPAVASVVGFKEKLVMIQLVDD